MNGRTLKFLLFVLLLSFAGFPAKTQNVPVVTEHPVMVGALTRDAGSYSYYSGPHDIISIQRFNRNLKLLESELASKVSGLQGISYQDRSATLELLDEIRISSGRDFDPTSGALRGLMGRLDYLVVIDALDGATATMRLIDVETGSVKGVENCLARAGHSPCIDAMVRHIVAASTERAGMIGDLAAARQQVMSLKPAWDDQVARYQAARDFWEHIQSTISSGGHALRPEIRTLLNGAATDVSTGQYAISHLDAESLRTATGTLTRKLDKLDEYR